ncbi:MAG TPA: hypothetical protein VEC11_14020, partial [Allosphingosinicella sp.]|nr:hypothetical protein [Allosphingosinicella sp.]
GTFDREQRPPVGPVSGPAPAHAPTTGGSTGNPGTPAPAPAPAGGQVTEQWLLGGWGQDCPTVNDPQLTFQPGGRFLLGSDPGDWLLQDNVITIRRDGQGNTSSMRWDYLGPDSALVTRLSTGDTYTVYRCG